MSFMAILICSILLVRRVSLLFCFLAELFFFYDILPCMHAGTVYHLIGGGGGENSIYLVIFPGSDKSFNLHIAL